MIKLLTYFIQFTLQLCLAFLFYQCSETTEEIKLEAAITEEVSFESKLIFHYEDKFLDQEKTVLEKWVNEVYDATTTTLGEYPFDVNVFFIPSNSKNDAVSFGTSVRKKGVSSIKLYVNPSAKYEDLMADWIAPHELSHLSIPSLGKSAKWFSEGYATFMSRQIMMEMGYYDQNSFDSLYNHRIAAIKSSFDFDSISFVERADQLIANHKYHEFYWGGASYFLTIDKRLRNERNMSLVDVIKEYQVCCRLKDKNLESIISSFDNIINDTWFNDLMTIYRNNPAKDALSAY